MAGSRLQFPPIHADGKHFSRTESLVQRGWSASRVLRHFIDGKPVKAAAWTEALAAARQADEQRQQEAV